MEVIVVETKPDPFMVTNPKPFLAYMASNPEIRALGRTEDEAVERLVRHVLAFTKGKYVVSAKVREVNFDELIVQEIMGS